MTMKSDRFTDLRTVDAAAAILGLKPSTRTFARGSNHVTGGRRS
jgi:hypothetical protein